MRLNIMFHSVLCVFLIKIKCHCQKFLKNEIFSNWAELWSIKAHKENNMLA